MDGPGFRTSIYCAGCAHRCPGCHNPQSWDFAGGKEVTVEELLEVIKSDEFANVTFSGGDPLYQVEAFTELARRRRLIRQSGAILVLLMRKSLLTLA